MNVKKLIEQLQGVEVPLWEHAAVIVRIGETDYEIEAVQEAPDVLRRVPVLAIHAKLKGP